jgi:membrane-associated phospholipid phosphatase
MNFLTDFADQAVMLPLVLSIAIGLLAQGWRRGAAAWVIAISATFSVMLLLKLLFIPCGSEEIHTPSGHVAAATVVLGGLAAMLRRRRGIVVPAGLLAAVIIGASRIALGFHTWPEVAVGAVVGLAGATVMQRLAGPPPTLDGRRLALIAVAVAVIFHGLHLPAEARISGTALRLAQLLNVCQSADMRL